VRVLLKSIPEVPVYPEGESKFTSDILNLQVLPLIKSMGLPHITRPYSAADAKGLMETYISHGCEAEFIE